MIKQLKIICSNELGEMVRKVLSKAGVQGYFRLDGEGTNVKEKSAYSHDLTWPACMYVVPAEEEKLRVIIDELKSYAGKCKEEPCLKLILSPVEEMH